MDSVRTSLIFLALEPRHMLTFPRLNARTNLDQEQLSGTSSVSTMATATRYIFLTRISSRDVKFDESSPIVPALAHNATKEVVGNSTVSFESTTLPDEDNEEPDSGDLFYPELEQEDEFLDAISYAGVLLDTEPVTHSPECTRSSRVVKPPGIYSTGSASMAIVLNVRMGNEKRTVHKSYREAMDSATAL